MKPLTAKEITILRNTEAAAASDPFGLDSVALRDCAVEVLPRLLDEVERSRALLKRIEWAGSAYPDASDRPCCPACDREHVHEPGCELAALIGAST